MRRWLVAAVAAVACALFPSTVFADSAGPTDYETSIIAVAPPNDGVTFRIEGGDAFVRAVVKPGHSLMVLGYDDEPYIRIDSDGAVWENQRSESYFYNLERFGADVPEHADSTAPADWVRVDDDGEHAWHDHRAHWMAEAPLIGLEPGQSLPPDEIDVLIDDVPTVITVEITLQPAASRGWIAIGALVGVVAAVAVGRGGEWGILGVGLFGGVAAVVLGIAHTFAVPASTGRPLWWWVPPVAGVAALAVGFVYRRDRAIVGTVGIGVGLELLVWGMFGWPGLTAAYRPTLLPDGLERVLTVAVPLVGGGLMAAGAQQLIRARRESAAA